MNMKKRIALRPLPILLLCAALVTAVHAQKKNSETKPNFVVILVDDMGFSDIGAFGSEIPTPNLNKLATNGVRFTQFYNASRCCPTRSALQSGVYPHQAGVGSMNSNLGP